MYKLFLIKRVIENIFIYPFILIGRLIARLYPLKKEYRIFFFFPFYHTGGAEKVHAQIAEATGGEDCIIYFTKRSSDKRFFEDFKNSRCQIKEISGFTDNKWLYFFNLIYRGIITGYINKQKQPPVVFNGQCNFAYKISPWIKRQIRQFELIHSLNSFSYIRIPFIPFIPFKNFFMREDRDWHNATGSSGIVFLSQTVSTLFEETVCLVIEGGDGSQNELVNNAIITQYFLKLNHV